MVADGRHSWEHRKRSASIGMEKSLERTAITCGVLRKLRHASGASTQRLLEPNQEPEPGTQNPEPNPEPMNPENPGNQNPEPRNPEPGEPRNHSTQQTQQRRLQHGV